VKACQCEGGCVECVANERCKEGNKVMSKMGAWVVLMCLLGRKDEIDMDALPMGEEGSGIETVIASFEVGGKVIKVEDGAERGVKQEEGF